MMFVAGLGNPGSKYEKTRHNAGFVVVDELGRRWGATLKSDRYGNLAGAAPIRGNKVVFAKPQKFMNLSGAPLRGLLGFYKGSEEALVVVHDEVDLPFGTLKIKLGGGHGGHNGLRDIHRHLGSNGYLRVRFGVGRPPAGWDTADYVLGHWTEAEAAALNDTVAKAADAVEVLVEEGLEAAMNQFHFRDASKKESPKPLLKAQSIQALTAVGV
jgi:PTH1 family peptidyl-tRNA hydrolase